MVFIKVYSVTYIKVKRYLYPFMKILYVRLLYCILIAHEWIFSGRMKYGF